MRRISLFGLALAALMMWSCEKDKPDRRDAYVGVYTCRMVNTGEDDQGSYSFVDEGVQLGVEKGVNANELLFDLGDDIVIVGILDPTQDDQVLLPDDLIDIQGDVYRIGGDGFFGNKTISLTLAASAVNFFDVGILAISGSKD